MTPRLIEIELRYLDGYRETHEVIGFRCSGYWLYLSYATGENLSVPAANLRAFKSRYKSDTPTEKAE